MRTVAASGMRWRTLAALVGLAELAAPLILFAMAEVETSSIVTAFALCAVPSAVGLLAALGRVAARTQVLLLWIAAALSGFVAAMTIMSGVGVILLIGMAGFLTAAWGLNAAGGRGS